jgi:hypothetical protein
MKAKTIHKFTRDALMKRPCMCERCRAARSTKTTDATPSPDLNEIHRRFWARIAGK